MDLKIIYEDNNLLVVDKPAGIIVFPEGKNNNDNQNQTIIDLLIEGYPELVETGFPPRYGIIHRIDKDTSGILLVAKNNDALNFFQEQFKTRQVQKKYIALVVGNIKQDSEIIETLIGRSPQNRLKQKVFSEIESGPGKRTAITKYRVLTRYKDFTLLEVMPKTGRKHQIRCHLSYINHPIAGDKLYGFKNQPCPNGLTRHFLHASYIKIKMQKNNEEEFKSALPEDLAKILEKLEKKE